MSTVVHGERLTQEGNVEPLVGVAKEAPWAGIKIPEGFVLAGEGVYRLGSNDASTLICGPVWETAKTNDQEQKTWGMQLQWIDPDGNTHEAAFPRTLLHDTGPGLLVGTLAAAGLFIVPGQERALKQYLASFKTTARLRSVAQTGWVSRADGKFSFVLPHRILGAGAVNTITFQPEENSPSRMSFETRGELEGWQRQVGTHLHGNPVLIFSTCVALCGPLLGLVNKDSCGFHLYGASSVGKTTALQVAASVWGNGADPAACANSSIQRWNTTANALEGIATAHNDIFLALDELGTFSGKDFGNTVYNFSGGRGKARMNKSAELQAQRGWRTASLSSGEISIQQRIEQDGRTPKAGQLNRFMDIPVQQGIIENSHNLSPADFANHLKRSCGEYFGALGPAFVESLLHHDESRELLDARISTRLAEIEKQLMIVGLQTDQQRAVRRLALVALAGTIAAEKKLLPVSVESVLGAIKQVRDRWLCVTQAEQVRGVLAIRDFILRHQGSRIHDVGEQPGLSYEERDLVGYFINAQSNYALTDAGFREACAGYDERAVANELKEQGLLHLGEGSRLKRKHSNLPGYEAGARPRLYTIRQSILAFEPAAGPGTVGTAGQAE